MSVRFFGLNQSKCITNDDIPTGALVLEYKQNSFEYSPKKSLFDQTGTKVINKIKSTSQGSVYKGMYIICTL